MRDITPQLYEKAISEYIKKNTITAVAKVLECNFITAKKIIKKGWGAYPPIEQEVPNFLERQKQLQIAKNHIDNNKEIPPELRKVIDDHLFNSVALYGAYRNRVATWLKGGKTDPNTGQFDPGISVKPTELKALIDLGFELKEKIDGGSKNVLVADIEDMSDEEWLELMTGRRKPR